MGLHGAASITRRRCWELLDYNQSRDGKARVIEICLMVLIILNVIAVSVESVPSIHAKYGGFFLVFEYFSVAVFSVEYLLRLWTAVEYPPTPEDADMGPWQRRWYFARQPLMFLDLLAIAPFYLALVLPLDLRMLRVLRLLRIFKLTRYSFAMTMLLDVIREESSSFLAGFFILCVMLVLASSGAYLVEHSVQPEKFGSIPAAMWWAVATLTTVGYGDVTPVTPLGKVFGAMVTVIGIGMAALPAGILANGMSKHLSERREDLRIEFRKALLDGVIDAEEKMALEELRRKLGIRDVDARAIRVEVEANLAGRSEVCHCPSCGCVFDSSTSVIIVPPPR